MPNYKIRPVYTEEELTQYFQLLFGSSHKLSTVSAVRQAIENDPVKTVGDIQTQHLAVIPFSTAEFIYSPTLIAESSFDPDVAFQSFVVKKQGGFCFQMNSFFSTVLRSIGIENYFAAGRISSAIHNQMLGTDEDPRGYSGLSHMLIIATIQGKKYNVDVGLPTYGITKPLLLEENASIQCIPGMEGRLVRETLYQAITNQVSWVYQTRNSHTNQWEPTCSFADTEFLPQDFDYLNAAFCTDPKTWTQRLLLGYMLILKDGEIEGTITMINNFVQRRVGGGEAEMLEVFGSEADRVQGMEKYFGIILSNEEIRGIVGRHLELKKAAN